MELDQEWSEAKECFRGLCEAWTLFKTRNNFSARITWEVDAILQILELRTRRASVPSSDDIKKFTMIVLAVINMIGHISA